jgi:hypothetical protein
MTYDDGMYMVGIEWNSCLAVSPIRCGGLGQCIAGLHYSPKASQKWEDRVCYTAATETNEALQ